MKIKSIDRIFQACCENRCFISVFKIGFKNKDYESGYYMVSREGTLIPHDCKKSDAVVVVAMCEDKLLLTQEFRIPIGVPELGFPAGLIDESDYDGVFDDQQVAFKAAIREVKEETGLDFLPIKSSPKNLYSSAGLTNESITFVFGKIIGGEISSNGLEVGESINAFLASVEEVKDLIEVESPNWGHSKSAWPFIYAFSKGFDLLQ